MIAPMDDINLTNDQPIRHSWGRHDPLPHGAVSKVRPASPDALADASPKIQRSMAEDAERVQKLKEKYNQLKQVWWVEHVETSYGKSPLCFRGTSINGS